MRVMRRSRSSNYDIMLRIQSISLALVMLCVSLRAKEMTEIEALASLPNRCTYEYAYDMYGAHCAGLKLTKIPNLRGGLEILDFSDNKLQELHGDTLSSYTSIKFLYLTENQIYLIDDDALSPLTDLEILDLSNNVILTFPESILQLPYLRKLYLRGNPLLHLSLSNLKISKPINAPLQLLDISDCKIKILPTWGNLPQLDFYNISHNPLASLDTNHFSAMCNLKKVDLTESIDKMKLCDIRSTILWFQEKRVNFHLKDYSKLNSKEFENCPTVDNAAIYNATYHRCKAHYLEIQNIRATRRTWLTIGGGLAGFLVGFILLLYVMHRYNVSQTKTTAEKVKQATPAHDPDKRATEVLLNNVA